MKSAIIYVRVSTVDPANNGVSLDAQEAKARAWAEIKVLAEFESDQISERTKLAMQYKKSKGEFTGGNRAPYGYTRGSDGKTLVPIESEQEVIKLVRQYRQDGLPLRAISAELERAGILSRTDKPFSPPQVQRIAKAA